jgi:hypothetical protein
MLGASGYHCCTCYSIQGVTCYHTPGSTAWGPEYCNLHYVSLIPMSDNQVLLEILKELKSIKSELELVKGRL